MLFDAHWHGFRVFGGVPGRGIYDSEAWPPWVRGQAERRPQWTVWAVARSGRSTSASSPWPTTMSSSRRPLGSDQWRRNERLLQSCVRVGLRRRGATGPSPPAQGQVEKNVQDARPRLWQPMPEFSDLAALNAWLERRCLELWREIPHGVLPGTVADAWAEEQAALMPLPPAFDGFVARSKRVSPPCLISFERNRDTRAVLRAYAAPLAPRSLRTLRQPARQPEGLPGSAGGCRRGTGPVRTCAGDPALPSPAVAQDP